MRFHQVTFHSVTNLRRTSARCMGDLVLRGDESLEKIVRASGERVWRAKETSWRSRCLRRFVAQAIRPPSPLRPGTLLVCRAQLSEMRQCQTSCQRPRRRSLEHPCPEERRLVCRRRAFPAHVEATGIPCRMCLAGIHHALTRVVQEQSKKWPGDDPNQLDPSEFNPLSPSQSRHPTKLSPLASHAPRRILRA
jgi:hypothetical protein